MLHRIKSGLAGLCCGLVIFASIPHTVFAQPLIKQTQRIGEVQNEISYFPNARMEEVSPSLLGEENPSADLAGSPRAGEIIYQVSSADEWNALLSGVTDSAFWSTPSALNPTTGTYNGTENVRIILDHDIVGTMDSITLSDRQVTFTLDLNGHSFQTQGGTLSIQSIGTRTNTLVLQNGNMAATGINANSAMGKIDIQDVDFTGISGNAVSGDHGGECFVSGCSFDHMPSSNNNTAIGVTNFTTVNISDVTIRDFGNGINASYASSAGGVDLSDITVSGANIGLDLSDSKVKVLNVTLSGNKASGSRGVNFGRIIGAASNLEGFLVGGLSDLSHVTISDFDSGILIQGSGTISLDNCKITNVNHGLISKDLAGINGYAHFNVRDSVLKANASIAEGGYSGDSYGIYAYNNGFACVNTEVTGFKVGAFSRSNTSAVANCTFDNLEYNIDSYYFEIYNSVLKNAKYGIRNNGASSVIMDTEVIGNKTPGSIGIQESGSTNLQIAPGVVSSTLISCVESAYPDAPHHDMIVSGYDIGLQCSSSTYMMISGIEVKDCGTGIKGFRYTDMRTDNPSGNYIHDCDYGIDCNNLNMANVNWYVYDCKETGVQIHTQLTGSSTPVLEIYGCKDGLTFDGTMLAGLHLRIHDNIGNGLAYTGDGSNVSTMINCSMEIYNNAGWNIVGDNIPMFHVASDTSNQYITRLENGGLGNVNVKPKNSSSSQYMYTASHLKSDGGVNYVYPGKEVWISPQSSASWTETTDWLEGCMVFDIENYTEGAIAAYAPETSVRTTSDQTEDTWNFVRTHFFAAKEGWVIRYDKTVGSGPTMYPLVFTEGCNVTYDYETNGGTGMSESYARISYLNGDAVDLSLAASRPGYDFLGWNTDPDAHEAISALTAQKEDITLYAIYRKAVTFTYHTYDPALDYTQSGYIFNKETLPYADQAGSQKVNALSYADRVPQSVYNYAGYSYDGRDTTNLFRDGEILSAEKTDIYCVYTMNGELQYLGPDGTFNDQQRVEAFYTILNTLPYQFSYVLKPFQAEKGYVFAGWRAADGMIYAPGSIYATDQTSAELQAEVTPISVSAISVSPKQATMNIGDTLQMSVQIQPEDALNQSVTWTSSDPSIAAIDANGLVTAYAEGSVTITATANDGSGCSDTATIEVGKKQEEPAANSSGNEPSATSESKPSSQPKTGDGFPLLPILLLGCLATWMAAFHAAAHRKEKDDN